jgi:hypothetical protein
MGFFDPWHVAAFLEHHQSGVANARMYALRD